MDMSSRIYWGALWSCCLLGFVLLTPTADAGTKVTPTLPTSQAAITSGTPAKIGTNLSYTAPPLTGQYIPGPPPGLKNTPIKVLPTIHHSIPRILQHAKSGIRGGAPGLLASAAVAAMLASIDALIDDDGVPKKRGYEPATTATMFWCAQSTPAGCNNTNASTKRRLTPDLNYPTEFAADVGPRAVICESKIVPISDTRVNYEFRVSLNGSCTNPPGVTIHNFFRHGVCQTGYVYIPEQRQCMIENSLIPLTDPDYDNMINFAQGQNAAWLDGLLKASCQGSLAPALCFQDLKSGSSLSGPATLTGPTTTKTTTTTSPSGITNQIVNTVTTTYNITYGDNNYTYNTTTKAVTTENGVPVSDETTTDDDDITSEEPPKEEDPTEEEQEQPLPCAGEICDGPAYEDQYEPTEETKEEHLDSYADRAANIPIIQAVSGMFDVSAAGNCPVWSYQGSAQILGMSMPIDLTFDYLCMSWFTQYGPWIRAVIYLVCVAIAIRIALL